MALQKEKTPMRNQEANVRNKNFKEVPLGYNIDEAKNEASRCLQCPNKPCVDACPVEVPIPEFIKAINNDNLEEAVDIIKSKNNLPAICGRVCPQESQCEEVCIMAKKNEAVAIGRLERFVGDYALNKIQENIDNNKSKKRKEKVAVVGAGPAGLTAAADLARAGFNVTLFEALHDTGGVLRYGIPEFRLPKKIVDQEVENIKKLGVEIQLNVIVGKTISIDELFTDNYQAIFIGTGAGLPRLMDIPGKNLNGVYSANEFLTRVNLMKAYKYPEYETPVKIGKKVAVIGGGNVAMDSARTALRLGADKVYVIYRRTEDQMPARNEEIEHAKEEGVIFKELNNPIAFHGNEGRIKKMECLKMSLGEKDKSGRPRPVPIENSNWMLEVDSVIIAIGQSPNPLLTANTNELKTQAWGGIIVNDDLSTSIDGVFAGGDTVTGAATVIKAMGAGKQAAKAMIEYIEEKE
ncbi:NADPH-dependent glutamate synthase [Natronospora cellulosivora (SeqCode)]